MIKIDKNTYAPIYSESQLCEAFVRKISQLKAIGYYKCDFELKHIPNEKLRTGNGKLDDNYTFKQIRMGMVLGAADYDISYTLPGENFCRIACIEFKKDKKGCNLKNNQKIYRERCLQLNKPYLCTYDIDEALRFVKELLSGTEPSSKNHP